MGLLKRKHGARAPRFKFDIKAGASGVAVRFATKSQRPVGARIFDVSESGIAILVSMALAPKVGQIVRLEFTPPGGMQIACLGRTVRIEDASKPTDWKKFPDTVKVGIVFVEMPRAYRQLLARGISDALGRQEYETKAAAPVREVFTPGKQAPTAWDWVQNNLGSILVTVLLGSLCLWTLYYATQKNIDTTSRNNSQWAEGFFQKVVPPKKSE